MDGKQIKLFRALSLFVYISGLPYFWFEELTWPKKIQKAWDIKSKFFNFLHYIFVFLVVSALITQKSSNEQQRFYILIVALSHPFLIASPESLQFFEKDVRRLIFEVAVILPAVYRDEQVEERVVKKVKLFMISAVGLVYLSLVAIGIDGLMQLLRGEVFSTVILAWPNLDNRSSLAGSFRVVTYIYWWIFIVRLSGSIATVICLLICTGQQFLHLQSYFLNIIAIFEEDIIQKQKEEKYERALKVGIEMHSNILRQIKILSKICNPTYSGQIIVNVSVIALLLARLTIEKATVSYTIFFVWPVR